MDDDPVVKGLLAAISRKRIRPGTKLVADQLVEAFGSNRIHIRQVFEHLGSRGIIHLYPNRGAFVAQPTVGEARQVFATRRIVERAAVVEVIDRLDAEAERALRDHVDAEHGHAHRDRWSTLSLTGDFHSLLARLTGNVVLAKIIDDLVLRTSLIIATFEGTGGADDCSPDAHPQIVDRIVANDRAGAAAAMEGHLRAMEDRLQFDGPPPAESLVAIFAELGEEKRRARVKAPT